MRIAASSTFTRVPSCWERTLPSPIPNTAGSIRIQVRATTWGAEPAESVHVEVKKSGVYDFNADYRDFAYYNILPSFADPLLGQGIVLDEQSFDTRRKIAALSLDILPGHWWTPYFGWDHDSELRHGRDGICQR